MDKDNNKLKDYYDQFLEDESTPAFVWERIADDLESNDMNLLSDSFDEFYANEEPDAIIAETIKDHLEQDQANALKENFDTFYTHEEPATPIWGNIQDQLDIDQTWTQIAPTLDKEKKWHQWKIRLKRITAVAMLLLLLRTCVGDGMIYQPFVASESSQQVEFITDNTIQTVVPVEQQQKTTIPSEQKNNTNNGTANPNHTSSSPNPIIPSVIIGEKEQTLNYTKPAKGKATETPEDQPLANTEQPLPPILANSTHNNTENTTLPILNIENTPSYINQPINKDPLTTVTSLADNTLLEHPKTSVNDFTPLTPSLNVSTETKLLLSSEALRTLSSTSLTSDSIILPLAEPLLFSLENKSKNPTQRFPKVALGLIGKLGTNLLLNSMTSESLRYKSFNNTQFHISGNIGFILSLQFDKKNALVIQAAPYTPIRQSYSAFSPTGLYYEQEIKLTYLDFAIGYERTLIQFKKQGQQPLASIFARVDLGVSYLSVEQIFQNDALIQEKAFNKFNYSVGLAVGSRSQIKRFSIDYGIFCSMGLNDLNNHTFLGNQTTNLLNLGGFLGIRYQL